MSKDIFVFIESKDGSIRKASFELLSKAREISAGFSSASCAVIAGSGIQEVAQNLKGCADKVIVVDNDKLNHYRWDTFTSVMEHLIKKYNPYALFGTSSVTGKDLFPRLAARLRAPLVSDAIGVDYEGKGLKIKKPLYGGRVISWITCTGESPQLITFRPNSFGVEKADLDSELINEEVTIREDGRINIVSIDKAASKKVDLQEADFIICGGRGMKESENFLVLDEIARIMGGRTGASRAVVDSKWRDYDDQIGKSGKTVSPKVYIGCGVSGALHHTMGMDTSKVIVAINKDPNALIFQYSDYGIVDDLFRILPALKEELKKAKEEV